MLVCVLRGMNNVVPRSGGIQHVEFAMNARGRPSVGPGSDHLSSMDIGMSWVYELRAIFHVAS
jgi:hypothetical protein